MQPSRTRTSTGAPIYTLEQQRRDAQNFAEQEAEYRRQLALNQQQMAAQQPQTDVPAQRAFPGSNPAMQEPGLLARTYNAINDFFTPDKSITEMVPVENNPLAAEPGVGIGGRQREQQLRRLEEEAVQAKKQPRR
jgi:hypothetical protein